MGGLDGRKRVGPWKRVNGDSASCIRLSSSADFLGELRETVSDLNKDPVNPRLARYAAIVAWSMRDWVEIELGRQVQHDRIKERCPELGYLQELANVFKHRTLKSPKAVTLTAAVKTGSFSRGFSRGFDIARLELVLEDGTNCGSRT